MNKFGVCRYDPYGYKSKVDDLVRFDTYKEAFEYYKKLVFKENQNEFDENIWIVYIDENDVIIQFDRLIKKILCLNYDLKE